MHENANAHILLNQRESGRADRHTLEEKKGIMISNVCMHIYFGKCTSNVLAVLFHLLIRA